MGVQVSPPGPAAVAVGTGAGSTPVQQTPLTPVFAQAAVNTAVVVTVPAVAGQTIRIAMLAWSYSAAPTGGQCNVVVNGVTILQLDDTTAGLEAPVIPGGGLICQAGQAAVITLAAAGAAVTGHLNVGYYYGP